MAQSQPAKIQCQFSKNPSGFQIILDNSNDPESTANSLDELPTNVKKTVENMNYQVSLEDNKVESLQSILKKDGLRISDCVPLLLDLFIATRDKSKMHKWIKMLRFVFTPSLNSYTVYIYCPDLQDSYCVVEFFTDKKDISGYSFLYFTEDIRTALENLALEIACYAGQFDVFQFLLKHRNPNESLTKLLRFAWNGLKHNESENSRKCVDLLLNQINRENVNIRDEHDLSAVYHLREAPEKVAALLEKGAYIGVQSSTLKPEVSYIDPTVLEKHFDKCIHFKNEYDEKSPKMNSFIEFNFENFISTEDNEHDNEMAAVKFIAESEEYKHLLTHPLVETFVMLKWLRLSLIFYLDFVFYFVFAVLTMWSFYEFHSSSQINAVLKWATMTLNVVYMLGKRILHFIFFSQNNWKVWISWARTLIKFSIVSIILLKNDISFLNSNDFLNRWCRTMAAICVLLIANDLFKMAGSIFLGFSKYYIMFMDVARSSLKSLQLCIVLIPAFVMAFCLLLGNEKPNIFTSFSTALMKTIVMSTGEFDFSNLNADFHALGPFVFLAFVFLISIVFMNLMNALAVGDTQRIVDDAEVVSMVQRCKLLAYYEELFNEKHTNSLRRKIFGCLIRYDVALDNRKRKIMLMKEGNRILFEWERSSVVHQNEKDETNTSAAKLVIDCSTINYSSNIEGNDPRVRLGMKGERTESRSSEELTPKSKCCSGFRLKWFWALYDRIFGNFNQNTLERANHISENKKKEPDDRIANLEAMLSEIKESLNGMSTKQEQSANIGSSSTDAPTESKNRKSCSVCESFWLQK